MTAELLAIGLQFAWSVAIVIVGFFLYKREKRNAFETLNLILEQEKEELLESFDIAQLKGEFISIVDEKFNIEELKTEFTEIVDERLQAAIDTIGESIGGLLTEPTVKKAFSIIGSQGGVAKADNSALDDMAKDMLDGPQFSAIRMGAEALGLDIESYIEKHGAARTIKAAQELARFAGVDIMNLNLGDLARPGPGGSGSNYYLGR